MKKALIVLNGNHADLSRITSAIDENTTVICADGGADLALQTGIIPHVVIGDLDSISSSTKKHLEHHTITWITYPKEKDYTDSELAIQYALDNTVDHITLCGLLGNRLDHLMSNIFHIAKLQVPITIIEGNQNIHIIHNHATLTGNLHDQLSLIPLFEDVEGITTYHLQYPLHNETLPLGSTRGISNVFLKETIEITIKKGTLLVIHILQ